MGPLKPARGMIRSSLVKTKIVFLWPSSCSGFVQKIARGGGALFPNLTLTAYERVLRAARLACGYAKLKVTPHMCRHGGASTDRFEEVYTGLEEIQKRGQWKSFSSVLRYEKHGRLVKVLNQVSAAKRLDASKIAKKIAKLL